MSIPKIVHYCWFGQSKMPKLSILCINSWRDQLKDYEFKLWNEDNFDINSNEYVKEAYEAKKYAFVSDYVRLFVLYHYGGLYMDTDVEVIKPLDKFLIHRAFSGCENEKNCLTGLMGSEANHPWIKRLLNDYNDRKFILPNGEFDTTTNVAYITKIMMDEYDWIPKNQYQQLKDDLHIYPSEYFCAKSFEKNKICVSNETYTIHHFAGSWHTPSEKIFRKFSQIVGPNITEVLKKLEKIKRKGI